MYKVLIASLAALLLLSIFPAKFPKPENRRVQTDETKSVRRVDPEIEGQSALAVDFSSGEVIFSKGPEQIRPLASLTKILSLWILVERIGLDEEVVISQTAVLAPEPSRLNPGEAWRALGLFSMAMVESSNDAVYALFEHAAKKHFFEKGFDESTSRSWFLDLMDKKTKFLGADSMRFYDLAGLDLSEDVSGAYGSAADILKIARASLVIQIWELSHASEVKTPDGKTYALRPTNLLYAELPNLIGAKTGFTDLAGGNLLVILEYPLGRPLGIVVLGSSEQGRFEDVKKIYEWIKSKKPL